MQLPALGVKRSPLAEDAGSLVFSSDLTLPSCLVYLYWVAKKLPAHLQLYKYKNQNTVRTDLGHKYHDSSFNSSVLDQDL